MQIEKCKKCKFESCLFEAFGETRCSEFGLPIHYMDYGKHECPFEENK